MDYININKRLWDDKTEVHFTSEFYDVESFVKGKSSLNSIELELLGDIKGKKILHLQCHFGMDTISLAKEGAIVTGVDLSEKAIARAEELNKKMGTDATFIQSDVYSLSQKLEEKFDIVYTSYGVLGWLPDMGLWGETVKKYLKPGGKLVLVEFHPVVWMFSYDFKTIEFPYSASEPIIEQVEGTYADRKADIQNQSVSWGHGLAAVLGSLLRQGLKIADFQEFDYSPYNCFQNMIEVEKGKFQVRGLENKLPMLYSVVAENQI